MSGKFWLLQLHNENQRTFHTKPIPWWDTIHFPDPSIHIRSVKSSNGNKKKINLGICVLNRHSPRHLWLLTRTHHPIFNGRVTDKEEKRKVSKHVGAFKVKWRKRFLVWWNQNGALCPSCKKFRLVDNKLGISTVSVNVLESNAGSSYLNPNPTGFGVALQRKLE